VFFYIPGRRRFHGNQNADQVSRKLCGFDPLRGRGKPGALSDEEQQQPYKAKGIDEKIMPTHQITFYDFGCKRIIEGKLIENEEDRAVFRVQDKEYGFAPFRPKGA
jgi:hypothetical protein